MCETPNEEQIPRWVFIAEKLFVVYQLETLRDGRGLHIAIDFDDTFNTEDKTVGINIGSSKVIWEVTGKSARMIDFWAPQGYFEFEPEDDRMPLFMAMMQYVSQVMGVDVLEPPLLDVPANRGNQIGWNAWRAHQQGGFFTLHDSRPQTPKKP